MMTNPAVYLIRMAVFLAVTSVVIGVLSPTLLGAFLGSPLLNGLILAILLLGIAWNLRQVLRLRPETAWVEAYQNRRDRLTVLPAPRLLAPMASMLASRDATGRGEQSRMTLSASAMRTLLDGIASRLDESRELSRYMTGLLIFLGLLGTFWGLLKTIGSVSDVIAGMTAGTGDLERLLDQLKSGLAQPLSGMGTAFSASMFGLAGALVLGFLDLTAGQAQNRFFNELEEWLAGLTRLSSGVLAEGEGSVPVFVQAMLEQTAENLESLQRILAQGEVSREHANQAILSLNERIIELTDSIRMNHQLTQRIVETQATLVPALQRLADLQAGDEVVRAHLRNIETGLSRLVAETAQGRAAATADLRNDLRLLTRTVAALAEEPR